MKNLWFCYYNKVSSLSFCQITKKLTKIRFFCWFIKTGEFFFNKLDGIIYKQVVLHLKCMRERSHVNIFSSFLFPVIFKFEIFLLKFYFISMVSANVLIYNINITQFLLYDIYQIIFLRGFLRIFQIVTITKHTYYLGF